MANGAMKPSAGFRRRPDETSFTRNLRYAIADSEERALVWGNSERRACAQGPDGAELFVDLAPGLPQFASLRW